LQVNAAGRAGSTSARRARSTRHRSRYGHRVRRTSRGTRVGILGQSADDGGARPPAGREVGRSRQPCAHRDRRHQSAQPRRTGTGAAAAHPSRPGRRRARRPLTVAVGASVGDGIVLEAGGSAVRSTCLIESAGPRARSTGPFEMMAFEFGRPVLSRPAYLSPSGLAGSCPPCPPQKSHKSGVGAVHPAKKAPRTARP
jgi:hypothetical protein